MENIHWPGVLFLDIETVPQHENFNLLSADFQKLYDEKTKRLRGDEVKASEYYDQYAGILAEFGKIICISVGYFPDGLRGKFRVKSFFGNDEKSFLIEFATLLEKHYAGDRNLLCGHNGKEFDFPYICRRMMILGIPLPKILQIQNKKPWEVKHLDTLELWKFGDYKHYTSLKLLAAIFGIPTPKDDIDGSQVRNVYYMEKDLNRIVTYCQKDVITTARLLQKMNNLDMVAEVEVEYL